MKCCKKELPKPDVIDDTAYFVCPECGDVREIKNYRIYSPKESLDIFEKEHGFRVPEQYINYAGSHSHQVIKLPVSTLENKNDYFGDAFYTIGTFLSLNHNDQISIFDSNWLINEWGLPNKLVLIEGDGHEWLALDYRNGVDEPQVIVIESEDSHFVVVANTFKQFIASLIPYEHVYDLDGNLIYEE